jgi:crotonobetainyl-CoA:carnitine CoA-transferase CaiB-like acyl-CoA transferase
MTLAPLDGVRIIECSMLGPAAITSALVDLGADVIKVEPPQGDYVREMTWPIVEGTSLMHLHINRGKRSLTLDLKKERARELFVELAKNADAVVEAMRPGALERLGIGYTKLKEVNPKIVFITISGYGMTGPYKDYPSHGIAYDTWAGVVKPEVTEDGFTVIGEHVSIGINAAPLYGAIGILAGIVHARATGEGMYLELGQSDAAAAFDWYRSESHKAYERGEAEVTGNKSDDYKRRAPGTAGMREGVRYQIYESADGHVLFMASEQAFWKNFCEGVGRPELFEQHPGSKYADHAIGDKELQRELQAIFKTKTSEDWLAFGGEVNTPIAPVNTPATIGNDPQFKARMDWIDRERLGAEQLPSPLRIVGEELPLPNKAPTVGEHSDDVLKDVFGYDEKTIAELRKSGALG